MQLLSGNQRPDLLTALLNISCSAPATENASLQILFKCPTPAIVFGNATNPQVLLTFDKVHNPLRLPRKSTSECPKVALTCGVLYILTSKCASRHNGVQFFICHMARWLCTRQFSEPTFRPSGATNHWKDTVFRDSLSFSRIYIFFLLTLSLLWSSLFYSSSSLWLFPSLLFICPYCPKFDF